MTSVNSSRAKNSEDRKAPAVSNNAALRGALLAFQRPALNPQHPNRGSSWAAGAGAASAASAAHRVPSRTDALRPALSTTLSSPLIHSQPRHTLETLSSINASIGSQPRKRPASKPYSGLNVPQSSDKFDHGVRPRTPSSIAAALAAARYSPKRLEVVPRVKSASTDGAQDQLPAPGTVTGVRRWLEDLDRTPEVVHVTSNKALSEDEEVSYFTNQNPIVTSGWRETASGLSDSDGLVTPDANELVPAIEIRSPKPLRNSSLAASLESVALASSTDSCLGLDRASSLARTIGDDDTVSYDDFEYDTSTLSRTLTPFSTLDTFSSSRPTAGWNEQESRAAALQAASRSMAASRLSNSSIQHPGARKTQMPPPPPPTKPSNLVTLRPTAHPQPDLSSAVEQRLQFTKREPSDSQQITQSLPAPRVHSYPNAVLASSLAASRVASPASQPPVILSRRHTDHPHAHPHAHHIRLPLPYRKAAHQPARTPSPIKAMARTLRKAKSSSEEDDARHGHHRSKMFKLRKHPHKHHEGDRKRWRDEISTRERKRYEGVWAANRGNPLPFTSQESEAISALDTLNSCVSNMVVRDIWTRSRLPVHVLEEVWDLVDQDQSGKLSKDQFVVGMWLVDQRLKGRKLPARVRESVWSSARGIYGAKVLRKRVKTP